MSTIQPISPTNSTNHRPSNGSGRSPLNQNTTRQITLITLHTQRVRGLTQRIDRDVKTMSYGHIARLEEAVINAEKIIEQAVENVAKFTRARERGCTRSIAVDSAELRSIENGGNG